MLFTAPVQIFRVKIGQNAGGEWCALSLESPYFCLVGRTEEEAFDRAKKILTSYFKDKPNARLKVEPCANIDKYFAPEFL